MLHMDRNRARHVPHCAKPIFAVGGPGSHPFLVFADLGSGLREKTVWSYTGETKTLSKGEYKLMAVSIRAYRAGQKPHQELNTFLQRFTIKLPTRTIARPGFEPGTLAPKA